MNDPAHKTHHYHLSPTETKAWVGRNAAAMASSRFFAVEQAKDLEKSEVAIHNHSGEVLETFRV